MLPRDERILTFELQRPDVLAATSRAILTASDANKLLAAELDALIATIDLADDAAVLDTVRRVFAFGPVESFLNADIRLGPLKAKVTAGFTTEEARTLCATWREMRCANSKLVDWCAVLTECTGSNTAPYFLGAGEGAMGAMYYIGNYMTKEAGKLSTALVVMSDAQKHLDAYGSKAANAGTPERDARFLMQRALIKSDTELALTQASGLLQGIGSYSTTESFLYVDNWRVVDYAKELIIDNAAAHIDDDAEEAGADLSGEQLGGGGSSGDASKSSHNADGADVFDALEIDQNDGRSS
jgi:hypothetical protein